MTSRPPPDGLAAFLDHARWFGGKGSPYAVTGVDVLTVLNHDPLVELWLVHVDENGSASSYHLPVEHRGWPEDRLSHAFIGQDGSTWLYDALHERDLTHLWLEFLDGSRTAEGVRVHRTGTAPLPAEPSGRAMTAEQSNTSLVFGTSLILKVFRTAQPGINPDVEVHAALARAGSPHVAQPFGWIESDTGVIAFAQEFLSGGAEGWELATSSVRDLIREGDLYAKEVGGDFAGEAYRLGVATAEVHAALRSSLPTDTWDSAELHRRSEFLTARLTAALDAAPALRPFADRVIGVYAELGTLTDPVPVQRIHGDLHLGQTMRVTSGWKILDFEGEPAKPLAERRALDSPLRDVAGMLRSFDYAARYPMVDAPPDPQAAYRAGEWAARNRDAFCDGYAKAAGGDPREQDVLLRAYEADKVVYEVAYESRMRPHWVSIPMSALERLAG
jgi:maltokinase